MRLFERTVGTAARTKRALSCSLPSACVAHVAGLRVVAHTAVLSLDGKRSSPV